MMQEILNDLERAMMVSNDLRSPPVLDRVSRLVPLGLRIGPITRCNDPLPSWGGEGDRVLDFVTVYRWRSSVGTLFRHTPNPILQSEVWSVKFYGTGLERYDRGTGPCPTPLEGDAFGSMTDAFSYLIRVLLCARPALPYSDVIQ